MAGAGLKLYWDPQTRSVTVEWCLKELQLDQAAIVPIEFKNGEHKGEEFRKVNPFGRLPALVDGNMKLFETGAILLYLAEAYSNNPTYTTPKARAKAAQWVLFANTNLSEVMFHDDMRQRFQQDVLTTLNSILAKQQYLDGDYTTFGVADVAVGSMLMYAVAFLPPEVTNLASYPNIVSYTDRLRQRPPAAASFPPPTSKA